MIVIVDYGLGNVGSVLNMFKRLRINAKISCNKEDIEMADKLILPGVGSFDKGMENLESLGLIQLLSERVLIKKVPILGICLGMQLFTKSSAEGILNGFGWIDAETKKFSFNTAATNIKIPHMGWNYLKLKKESKLFLNYDELESRFYFVHSYCVHCNNEDDILSETIYGITFTSSIQKENIFATQFHPEKSHKYGLNLLKNFAEI